MFEIDKDCSNDRERLERLWRQGASTVPESTGTAPRDLTRGDGFWSILGFTLASFLFAMVLAFICTIFSIRPEMVSYPVQVAPEKPSSTLQDIPVNRVIAASRSTITGIVDSQSMSAAQYWTMILRADSGSKNEGEFDLVVPPGTALSRVTLWVNGVAQEAAFNSTERVSTAYSSIVSQMRDPVLVTWKSTDRYHVKIFPVSSSSDYKFRLGMTVPLDLDQKGQLRLTVPHVENANIRVDTLQDIHLESDVPLSSNRGDIQSEPREGRFLVRGNIPYEHMERVAFTGVRGDSSNSLVVRATHSKPAAFIVANLEQSSNGSKLVLRKSLTQPESAKLLKYEHVAHRLSG